MRDVQLQNHQNRTCSSQGPLGSQFIQFITVFDKFKVLQSVETEEESTDDGT